MNQLDKLQISESNYNQFVNIFSRELSNIGNPDISLMIYGSFIRNKYTPGRSDIDGVLILPNEVITDKDMFLECSQAFKRAKIGNDIPLQISVSDLGSIQDGRINSYGDDFKDYFLNEGEILIGPDYRDRMDYFPVKDGVLQTLSFNLRKSRTGLLNCLYDSEFDYKRFEKTFEKGIDSTINSSKKIKQLLENELELNKFGAIQYVKEKFPQIDAEPLDIINNLYNDFSKFNKIKQNKGQMINLWLKSLTTNEQIIKQYIENVSKQDTIQNHIKSLEQKMLIL